MARLFTSGFELNSVTSGVEWDTVSGAGVTIDSTTKRSGTYALKVTSTTGTRQGVIKQFRTSSAAAGPFYLRFYLYVSALPSTDNIIGTFSNGTSISSGAWGDLYLRSSGALALYYNNGTSFIQVGSDSSALSTGTWYRIEWKLDTTGGAGASVAELQIDGATAATASNLTYGASGFLAFRIGTNMTAGGDTTGVVYFDDVALNDSSGSAQTSYPGAGNVLTLRPNAAGDANTFATQTGGTAGAANNYTRVNENPPNDVTSYNGSTTVNQEDMFNVDDSGIGASDTVNVVEVHGRHRNDTADTAQTIKYQIKKAASGAITQGSAVIPNSTTWKTDAIAAPFLPTLTTYQDPDAGSWTQTTLDSMQIGYKLTVDGTGSRQIQVSNVWATIDYTPSSATPIEFDNSALRADPNLLAYYKLESSSADETANAFAGTDTDITYAAAKWNNGASMNGTSSVIDLPNLGISGSQARTVMFWVKRGASTAIRTLFSFGDSSGGIRTAFNIHVSGSATGDVYAGFIGDDYHTAAGLITTSAFSQVAVVYDGGTISTSTMHIYVNGVAQTLSGTGGVAAANTTDDNYQIGSDIYATTRHFDGVIDDVAVFNRALSATEIADLYAGTKKGKIVSGSLSFSGSISKSISRALTAAASFVGSLATSLTHPSSNNYTQALTGALSFTGAQTKRTRKTLSGGASFTGSVTRVISRGLTATASFTGSFNKRTSKTTMTASLSFTGSFVKRALKTLSGGLSFTGASPVKAIIHKLAGTLSFTGSQSKRTSHGLTGSLGFTGNLNKFITKVAMTAALSFTGALAKGSLFFRSLTGSLSFTGAQTKRTGKALTAAASFTGSIKRAVRHGLTGALSFTGNTAKRTSRAYTAALSFSGSIAKRIGKAFTGALSYAGSLATSFIAGAGGGNHYVQAFTASLGFTGAQSKRTSKRMTSSLSFIGSLASHLFAVAQAALAILAKFSDPLIQIVFGLPTVKATFSEPSIAAKLSDPELTATFTEPTITAKFNNPSIDGKAI